MISAAMLFTKEGGKVGLCQRNGIAVPLAFQTVEKPMSQLLVIDGVSVRRDIDGRYCLNDLHRAAVASGANDRTKEPAKFLSSPQTLELLNELTVTQDLGIDPVQSIRGGATQGTYVCKELVYSYAMWISPTFHLKVIRTFDKVVSSPEPALSAAADKMQAGVILLGFMQRSLNLSNSSVLGACQKLQEAVGLPNLAPQYAIDSPADAVDGSSRPTQSLSALLKTHKIAMTAAQAYQQLVKLGVVEQKERRSRSGSNGVKRFWALTAKGCMYGKNITSPANPRETQPHFFESRFADLLRLLDTVH
ncbi:KilA-N domain protein [Enterobacter sp. FY-07]|nr:KilA-N domain protein [Enterobacter sp. FY-07]